MTLQNLGPYDSPGPHGTPQTLSQVNLTKKGQFNLLLGIILIIGTSLGISVAVLTRQKPASSAEPLDEVINEVTYEPVKEQKPDSVAEPLDEATNEVLYEPMEQRKPASISESLDQVKNEVLYERMKQREPGSKRYLPPGYVLLKPCGEAWQLQSFLCPLPNSKSGLPKGSLLLMYRKGGWQVMTRLPTSPTTTRVPTGQLWGEPCGDAYHITTHAPASMNQPTDEPTAGSFEQVENEVLYQQMKQQKHGSITYLPSGYVLMEPWREAWQLQPFLYGLPNSKSGLPKGSLLLKYRKGGWQVMSRLPISPTATSLPAGQLFMEPCKDGSCHITTHLPGSPTSKRLPKGSLLLASMEGWCFLTRLPTSLTSKQP